jgi:hypothetical protein
VIFYYFKSPLVAHLEPDAHASLVSQVESMHNKRSCVIMFRKEDLDLALVGLQLCHLSTYDRKQDNL